MPPQTTRSNALRIAELVRERRKRMAQYAKTELDEPSSFLAKATAAGRYGGDIINELNRVLLSFLPANSSANAQSPRLILRFSLMDWILGMYLVRNCPLYLLLLDFLE